MNLWCLLGGHTWMEFLLPCSDDCEYCEQAGGPARCERCGKGGEAKKEARD